ncbi:hypothetical protein AB1K70_20225 [Bremerella sp. JC770]|uniref:hypothetical protein n=1 Tax=Bremerella sp. JC770 TaxID=3232137 RepID=UPI00345ACB1F
MSSWKLPWSVFASCVRSSVGLLLVFGGEEKGVDIDVGLGFAELSKNRPEGKAPPLDLLDITPLKRINQFDNAPPALFRIAGVSVRLIESPKRQQAIGPSKKPLPEL